VEDTCGRVNGGDEGERIWLIASYTYMRQNSETSCNCFKQGGGGLGGGQGDSGGNLTNVQCKVIWNCHNECPIYDESMLIKMKNNEVF
jgi:hypothetical protein